MEAIYDVAAPAKLNLFLHITGRRSDGYHLLQSVFMLIDWCDTLHFERRGDGQISREDLTSPQTETRPADQLPANDLCVRAARALQLHLPMGHPGCPHWPDQKHSCPSWHGRRLFRRGQHTAGAQPAVELPV